jgi:hypothetical protein
MHMETSSSESKKTLCRNLKLLMLLNLNNGKIVIITNLNTNKIILVSNNQEEAVCSKMEWEVDIITKWTAEEVCSSKTKVISTSRTDPIKIMASTNKWIQIWK